MILALSDHMVAAAKRPIRSLPKAAYVLAGGASESGNLLTCSPGPLPNQKFGFGMEAAGLRLSMELRTIPRRTIMGGNRQVPLLH